MDYIGNSSKGMLHRSVRKPKKYVSKCSDAGAFSTGRKRVEITTVRHYTPGRVANSPSVCKVCF